MRKLGLVLIGMTVMLTGCGSTPVNTPAPYQQPATEQQTQNNTQTQTSSGQASVDHNLIVWKTVNGTGTEENIAVAKDTQTGCEYIEFDNKTVTPRLDRDGKPMCNTGN